MNLSTRRNWIKGVSVAVGGLMLHDRATAMVEAMGDMKSPKITKIEIKRIEWKIKDCGPGSYSFATTYNPGASLSMGRFMTSIYTDQGIVGSYPVPHDISRIAHGLIGRNPLSRESIWKDFNKFHLRGMHGAIDIILWDILGKMTNLSISNLLGGDRKKLPAYASTMNGGEEGLKGGLSTPESYADFAEQCMEIGYKGFKIHPYPRPKIQDHIDMIHAVSDRVGGKMDLMLDAFNYYSTFGDALKVCKACDEAGFYWIEDPYFIGGGTTDNGHQRLKSLVDTPLLQGEKVAGIPGKMNMLIAGSTDFIRGNMESDGITGTKKLASAAETVGADIEIHGVGPAQRHTMSAIGNSNYYEMVWVHPDTECLQLTSDIFLDGYKDGLEAVDSEGNVDVPDGPGMGVEWDWDVINKMSTGTKIID